LEELAMKLIKLLMVTACFGLATVSQGTVAQTDFTRSVQGKREVLKMGLYPPDIIMRHQVALGITMPQREEIIDAVKRFQSDVADLQWTMQGEQQKMQQAFAAYTIDTTESLALAEKVLALESRFKLAHLELLITIKNALTEEQIDKINQEIALRRKAMGNTGE
jgi:Spy/CpxP family protein refolding chaperone